MKNNSINNECLSLTADTFITAGTIVTANTGLVAVSGGADITGNTIIDGGTVDISTDSATNAVNIGTAGARTVTLGSVTTTAATTLRSGSGALNVTSTNGALTVNSGTGALSISNDASATTLTIGTGGAVKTVTLGSTNTTSVTNIACGTGGCNVGTSANAHATVVGSTTASATTTIQGPSAGVFMTGVAGVSVSNLNVVTINTSTGALGSQAAASGDVTAAANLTDNAVVRGDGGAKGVQTSTVLITDAGEMTNPSQPAFSAYLTATVTNQTGDGTLYTIAWDAERFDQNSDFSGSTFTAPVTGKYMFAAYADINNLGVAHTQYELIFTTSNSPYYFDRGNPFVQVVGGGTQYTAGGSFLADMDTADTCIVQLAVYNSTKTVGVASDGSSAFSSFSGYLAC